MPKKRSQIHYMVTLYITAHGRAETETNSFLNLRQRDVYIGQETGNCGVQSRQHDENLLNTVTDWNKVATWLKSGAEISSVEHEDYKIGTFMFENQVDVVYNTSNAIVGPTRKRDKIMDMEGKVGEISRPGIVIVIQERETKNPELSKSMIRSILNKTYTRGGSELKRDPTGIDHRFSAIYLNNQFIEPNDRTHKNVLSKEFNDYVTNNSELSLSDIVETTKSYASRIIGLKPNSKNVLYTIADTTCNVYATEDIKATPLPDQNEIGIAKSSRKAMALATLLDTREECLIDNARPEIVAVTPNHDSGFWFTMKPESRRLRTRPSDRPGKIADTNQYQIEEVKKPDNYDESSRNNPYVYLNISSSEEFPSLVKRTHKKAPKKKHQCCKKTMKNIHRLKHHDVHNSKKEGKQSRKTRRSGKYHEKN